MSRFSLTIVGAGSSSSTPMLKCLLSKSPCAQCADASANGFESPNHRLNPSALLQVVDESSTTLRNLYVDPGKTFRESAIKVLKPRGVRYLDAVIITHDHADACWGIDDLREFTRDGEALDVYCDSRTLVSMRRVYPYLFDREGGGSAKTFVARVNWCVMSDAFDFFGVTVRPVPVYHGEGYINNGIVFESGPQKALYLEDVSAIPDASAATVQDEFDVAVVDMLSTKPYPTHFSVDQAVHFATSLRAKKIRFVGMSHSLPFLETNEMLSR
eukprot:CAMPEP_0174863740 /NCGR_PEP_ID=MMETSP1114-20130205/56856_1 /TAXON_ID=312471 /ORGANISM="Neobodo designis, Strain CCAP 1951/1" /LENGTH=270 /DNA_ID=CAMNT_0016098817 /DNA_START=26 /DNA_END=834 /DNA_ORIENTATION=+